MPNHPHNRLSIDGKFFCIDGQRVWIKSITYGPFPTPHPDVFEDFAAIVQAGFQAVRIYEPPSPQLLEAALEHDLLLFIGVPWQWYRVFIGDGGDTFWHEARISFLRELSEWGCHPAVAAIYLANEIPADIARWQGYARTRQALDDLIEDLRGHYPHLLYAYSSFPTSEYLEPSMADFTAINVYLEEKAKLQNYLNHLQHVAGDRPVMISEFGMDTDRNGDERQAEVLGWQLQQMRAAGTAGATVFAWSDNWRNGDKTVPDWSFGLNDRNDHPKPALEVVAQQVKLPPLSRYPYISVIICVHNGADRLRPALDLLDQLNYPSYEVLIVDDGSRDGLAEMMEQLPQYRYIRQQHAGLSAARNLGASQAQGDIFAYTDDDCIPDRDWLYWLAKAYDDLNCDLCGGPNLPPLALDADEAIVAAAPGAPTHVMLNDTDAEHLPGCNLTIKREAFELIGGFNERYWIAGDDVDFCWRAEKRDLKLGFHGAAFVWHRRRTSFMRYLKQQRGYGKAEALLMEDHPERFNEIGDARWKGVVYSGGAMAARNEDTIYAGRFGTADFQHMHSGVMPSRPLQGRFRDSANSFKLRLAQRWQPLLRAISRVYFSKHPYSLPNYLCALARNLHHNNTVSPNESVIIHLRHQPFDAKQQWLEQKLTDGWQESEDSHWDLAHSDGSYLLACMEHVGNDSWDLRVKRKGP